MTKRKSTTKGSVICSECLAKIDLDWFARMKFTGRVVHDCGRILWTDTVKK